MDTTPSSQPSPGSDEQRPGQTPPGKAQDPGAPPPTNPQPQWGPAPQAQPPATTSFFDSLRRSGTWRSQERWVGGVCGGLAQRFGIDPALVRVATVLLTIFTGLGLLAYCLAWLLLPEQADGRIHLEEALHGNVCAGFVGAVTGVVLGVGAATDSGFLPLWYPGIWFGDVFELVLLVSLVALGVWALVAWLGRPRTPSPTQPLAPQAPAAQPFAGPATTGPAGQGAAGPGPFPGAAAPGGWAPSQAHAPGSAPQWAPAQPGQPGPAPAGSPGPQPLPPNAVRPGATPPAFNPAGAGPAFATPPVHPSTAYAPPPPRVLPVPGPGRTVSLLVMGLSLLSVAAFWLLLTYRGSDVLSVPLVCAGAVVMLVGAGIIVSGLRGRRGGWLSVVGGVLAVLLTPVLLLNPVLPRHGVPYPLNDGDFVPLVRTITWQEISSGAVTSVDTGAGTLVVDLTGMPTSTTTPRTLEIDLGVGDLDIVVPPGSPVRVSADVGVGELRVDTSSAWRIGDMALDAPSPEPAWSTKTYTANGEPFEDFHHTTSGLGTKAVLTSPDSFGAPVLNVEADLGVGDIHVYESVDDNPLWHGTVIEDLGVWVVDYWTVSEGASDSTLPVPGTYHDAISVPQSQACYDKADPTGTASGTHPVLLEGGIFKGLDDAQFKVYKDCVLESVNGVEPEASGPGAGATQPTAPTSPGPAATVEATPY